ncbi:hypothetical protein MBLNU230_g7818t1 [Neophaeotheca triangularis]
MSNSYICSSCRTAFRQKLRNTFSTVALSRRTYTRPSFAPKPVLNLKHIRQNPGLYEQNCIDRNYAPYARNGWRILELHEECVRLRKETRELRQRNNALGKELGRQGPEAGRSELLEKARELKGQLAGADAREKEMEVEMERLALALPNLSGDRTPSGGQAEVLGFVGEKAEGAGSKGRSHVDIGLELDLLDFEASATTSGWGWYFLKNEAALLEQALVQFALQRAMERGFRIITPPSLVYGHIGAACGFLPRDQSGETQVYAIEGSAGSNGAELVLAGTAEIPFAGYKAGKTMDASELPLKVAGPSRCYRAEAGARGVDTKGLYRVHEFTKVEMFAWTLPRAHQQEASDDRFGDDDESTLPSQSDSVFQDMLAVQQDVISSLGLHAQILEMPAHDLGASAARKVDIEAWFPSRGAYGEITSTSVCTDYQARRLGTTFKSQGTGEKGFPETVNGTALAVPRVLAAILENGWDEGRRQVKVPECLKLWMPPTSRDWIGLGQ